MTPNRDSNLRRRPAQSGTAATPRVPAAPDHILSGFGCWCGPYRDSIDPEVIIHRKPVLT